ncbi:glycolate oxidase subunit GlcE [Aureimonas leprariae]|uniref:Glycolate oxidase subunit GlcE n=1 Tax=Plantimonas leprariae TaxID=2615207 RepID=A0A7V7PSR9_9HYPH|nr:glycolate oxidase subunit GlcE [Aureimonas leprariae]KAB0682616.1 glycolate oxidase subunit GlcE [Aureimonas leprariae]
MDATILHPQSDADVVEAIRDALAEGAPLGVEGTGSKSGLGRPVQAARTLSLAELSGVTLYEPEELVLSARAGTPIAEIERLLAENRQRLDFEPMDYGPLHGLGPGLGTLGGVLACNLSGPRRIAKGAARDHVLGIKAVSGRGEAFRSGGRVVKNVTGYDLAKGMAGSFGTLAVLTEATLKVLPAAETETTLAVRDLDEASSVQAMAAAMGSSAEVSGAAHLPAYVAGRIADGTLGDAPATLIRLEGFGVSVEARAAYLSAALSRVGTLERRDGEASAALWRNVRDVRPFVDGTERPIWRLSVTPTRAPDIVLAVRMRMAADAFYDWQGGLVWLRLEAEAEAETVRAIVAAHGGGHATLVRAAPTVRAATAVFQPQPPALAALSRRLKEQFDPRGVLNPGRMG